MHKIGSDTIIASSTELKRSSRDGLRESALFKDFAIDGADGYTAAEASLSTGETIERVFTYSAHYPFYSDALQCADRSGAADVGGRRYTYWLLPANGEDACVASDGKYSLVVAVNERGADDAALSTVENAELYGMKVYLGMPIPQMGQPGTSGYPAYVADDSYMGTLGAFTRNLLRSWMQAFGARTSFAGLYQGRETSVVQDHRRSPAHAQRLCVPERRCRRLPAGGEAPRRVQPLRLFRGSEPCGIFRGPVPGHRAYGCRKGRRHPRAPGRRRHGEGEPERQGLGGLARECHHAVRRGAERERERDVGEYRAVRSRQLDLSGGKHHIHLRLQRPQGSYRSADRARRAVCSEDTGLRLVHVHEQGSRVGGLSGDSRVLPAQGRCPE
mgnify:FL=1